MAAPVDPLDRIDPLDRPDRPHRPPLVVRLLPLELRVGLVIAWFLTAIGAGGVGAAAAVVVVVAGVAVRRGPARWSLHEGGRVTLVLTLACVAVAVLAPFVAASSFRVAQLSTLAYTVLALLGLNLVVGVAGQMALAHVAFMGIGGYAVAIATGRHGRTLFEALVVAAVLAAVAGVLIAVPTLRLSGHYLAIATLSVAIVFGPVMKLEALSDWTGGVQGISMFDHRFPPPIDAAWLTDDRWIYFLGAILAGLGVLVFLRINDSPSGRALRSVRDDRLAAAAMGINVRAARITAFTLSAAFAGVAGGLLFVASNRFVSPDNFTLMAMIELLVALIIGGLASARGAVLGGLFLVFVYRDAVSALSREVGNGEYLDISLLAGLVAVLIAYRRVAPPAGLDARLSRTPVSGRTAFSALVGVVVAAASYALWTLVGDDFEPIGLGNLITGIVLIVTVLAVPEGLASLVTPAPLRPPLDGTTPGAGRAAGDAGRPGDPGPAGRGPAGRGNGSDDADTRDGTHRGGVMRRTLAARPGGRLLASLVVVVAMVAGVGCAAEESGGGESGASSEENRDLEPGAAGIESEPRDVGGMFELDDGIAIFDERPAGEDRTGVTDDEIVIGKHSPITGPLAPIAMGPMVEALFDAINDAGGIHGRRLVLEDRDSAANPALATQVVRELVENDQVFGMLASQITAAHLAVLPYLEQNGVPDWSPNSSVPAIAEPPAATRFATLTPSQIDAHIAADYTFNDQGADKVALIYQNDDFGRAWLDPIRQVAEDAGGEVEEISFELAASADLTSQVQQAVASRPDWILVQSQFPQFSQMFTTLRDSLGSDIPVFAAPAASSGIVAGDERFEGVVTDQWSNTAGDAGNEVIENLLRLFDDEGVTVVTVAAVVLFQVESFARALELAGPDLTREVFLEAAEIGFDGSWTCSVCFGPIQYGPDDHWGIETLHLAEWDAAGGTWSYLGEPLNYETSDGNGLRDVLPEVID